MKNFTIVTLKEKMEKSDALNFYARLNRKNLGTYKMCSYSNSRCKHILQSMKHFDIDKCLKSSLSENDKEFLKMLQNETD